MWEGGGRPERTQLASISQGHHRSTAGRPWTTSVEDQPGVHSRPPLLIHFQNIHSPVLPDLLQILAQFILRPRGPEPLFPPQVTSSCQWSLTTCSSSESASFPKAFMVPSVAGYFSFALSDWVSLFPGELEFAPSLGQAYSSCLCRGAHGPELPHRQAVCLEGQKPGATPLFGAPGAVLPSGSWAFPLDFLHRVSSVCGFLKTSSKSCEDLSGEKQGSLCSSFLLSPRGCPLGALKGLGIRLTGRRGWDPQGVCTWWHLGGSVCVYAVMVTSR